jgi:hypothetical protein
MLNYNSECKYLLTYLVINFYYFRWQEKIIENNKI